MVSLGIFESVIVKLEGSGSGCLACRQTFLDALHDVSFKLSQQEGVLS